MTQRWSERGRVGKDEVRANEKCRKQVTRESKVKRKSKRKRRITIQEIKRRLPQGFLAVYSETFLHIFACRV